jgi:hypothetical protein
MYISQRHYTDAIARRALSNQSTATQVNPIYSLVIIMLWGKGRQSDTLANVTSIEKQIIQLEDPKHLVCISYFVRDKQLSVIICSSN